MSIKNTKSFMFYEGILINSNKTLKVVYLYKYIYIYIDLCNNVI